MRAKLEGSQHVFSPAMGISYRLDLEGKEVPFL